MSADFHIGTVTVAYSLQKNTWGRKYQELLDQELLKRDTPCLSQPPFWNKFINRAPPAPDGISLGSRIIDDERSTVRCRLSSKQRTEHLVILGKTGTGKTS